MTSISNRAGSVCSETMELSSDHEYESEDNWIIPSESSLSCDQDSFLEEAAGTPGDDIFDKDENLANEHQNLSSKANIVVSEVLAMDPFPALSLPDSKPEECHLHYKLSAADASGAPPYQQPRTESNPNRFSYADLLMISNVILPPYTNGVVWLESPTHIVPSNVANGSANCSTLLSDSVPIPVPTITSCTPHDAKDKVVPFTRNHDDSSNSRTPLDAHHEPSQLCRESGAFKLGDAIVIGEKGLSYDLSKINDERHRKRLLKNRRTAEESRLRRKAKMEELQSTVDQLVTRKELIVKENLLLREENSSLKKKMMRNVRCG